MNMYQQSSGTMYSNRPPPMYSEVMTEQQNRMQQMMNSSQSYPNQNLYPNYGSNPQNTYSNQGISSSHHQYYTHQQHVQTNQSWTGGTGSYQNSQYHVPATHSRSQVPGHDSRQSIQPEQTPVQYNQQQSVNSKHNYMLPNQSNPYQYQNPQYPQHQQSQHRSGSSQQQSHNPHLSSSSKNTGFPVNLQQEALIAALMESSNTRKRNPSSTYRQNESNCVNNAGRVVQAPQSNSTGRWYRLPTTTGESTGTNSVQEQLPTTHTSTTTYQTSTIQQPAAWKSPSQQHSASANELTKLLTHDIELPEPPLILPVLNPPSRTSPIKATTPAAIVKKEKMNAGLSCPAAANRPAINPSMYQGDQLVSDSLPSPSSDNQISEIQRLRKSLDGPPNHPICTISNVYSNAPEVLKHCDEKTREAAFRELKKLHKKDKLSSESVSGSNFRKPKEVSRKRQRSSESCGSSGSPDAGPRVTDSPVASSLADASKKQKLLDQSAVSPKGKTVSDNEIRSSWSPNSDTTIAYCDDLDPSDNVLSTDKDSHHFSSTLKGIMNEVEESIKSRSQLFLGPGTLCNSTKELFDETLKTNSQDRMTPLRQNSVSPDMSPGQNSVPLIGCVLLCNNQVRYSVSEGKRYYVFIDFADYVSKCRDLQKTNYSDIRGCSDSEASLMNQNYSKLKTVAEGYRLVHFVLEPDVFKEGSSECSQNCDSYSNLTEDRLSLHNEQSKTCEDSSVSLKTWLQGSSQCDEETNGAKTCVDNGAKQHADNSGDGVRLKEEIERLFTMSPDVIKKVFLDLMSECTQLKTENKTLKEQVEIQKMQNNLLEDMLEKVSSIL